MRPYVIMLVVLASGLGLPTFAELITYNSPLPEQNAMARAGFLAEMGIQLSQFRVDFETGFVDAQDISNQPGLFPAGLVIRDTSPDDAAIIKSGPGSISLSNPVGQFAVTFDGGPSDVLELDFSASPVDYVAYQDIDTTSNNSIITLVFSNGSTMNFFSDDTLTFGDSAEFLGFFRNDLPQISKLRLRLSGDLYGIDNIEYGIVPEDVLPGDYNFNGVVDAADYVVWRDQIGGQAGYNRWQRQFGETANADASPSAVGLAIAVPEPACIALVSLGIATVYCRRTSRAKSLASC
jgi:hypothetical protein